MKRFLGLFLASAWSLSSVAAGNGSIACWSKEFGKRPIEIRWSKSEASFTFNNKTCTLARVDYNPVSPKYKGWIRFANSNPIDRTTYKTACTDAMSDFYNHSASKPTSFPDVHWISLSREVQETAQGVLQLGWENLWDPGAGATLKTMLGCRASK